MYDLLELNLAGNDVVTVGATSAQSAAMYFNKIHLCSTTACWVNIGTNPTAAAATDGNIYLPANMPMLIKINSGAKVAVIQASAGGYLSVTPVSF